MVCIILYAVTPELCSKAVMEAKQWLEEKKVASSSKSGMDRGTCTLSSVARSQVVIIFYDLLLPPYFMLVEQSGSRCGIGSGGDKILRLGVREEHFERIYKIYI